MKKLIEDKEDKEVAIVLCTGIIALARIIGGDTIATQPDEFLNNCEKLSRAYVEKLIKANPTL